MTPHPTPDDIAAATAEIRAEWDAETERSRQYDPPHAAFYHVLALALGADERRAWRLFMDAAYRPDRAATIPRLKRPRL